MPLCGPVHGDLVTSRHLFSVTSTSSLGGATVVTLGEVDLETAPRLRDELLQHLRPGVTVRLDLGGVTFMDSSGLQALLTSLRRASLVGAELQLVRLSSRVQRLLELTGTTRLLEPPPSPRPDPPLPPGRSSPPASTVEASGRSASSAGRESGFAPV
jgi:anti-sigma B factor antagonist